jgi:hypothetical protein
MMFAQDDDPSTPDGDQTGGGPKAVKRPQLKVVK